MKIPESLQPLCGVILFISIFVLYILGIQWAGAIAKSQCSIRDYPIAQGTIVDYEYIAKPSTFGPDMEITILKFKDGRVKTINTIVDEIIMNKPVIIYKFNWTTYMEVL
jgi:hypothetical protein